MKMSRMQVKNNGRTSERSHGSTAFGISDARHDIQPQTVRSSVLQAAIASSANVSLLATIFRIEVSHTTR